MLVEAPPLDSEVQANVFSPPFPTTYSQLKAHVQENNSPPDLSTRQCSDETNCAESSTIRSIGLFHMYILTQVPR